RGEDRVSNRLRLGDRRRWLGNAYTLLAREPAALVSQRPTRHRVQPGQRLIRYPVELAPADEERLRDSILHDRLRRSPSDEHTHGLAMFLVDLLEPPHLPSLCHDHQPGYSDLSATAPSIATGLM